MDFSDPNQLMKTIAIGDKTGMFMIPITDDIKNEGNEAFTLAITGITGAVASDKTDAFSQVITIIDDEDPKISFEESTINIAESDEMVELDVNISGATTNPVVITYETIDGTAASPGDYTGISSANPKTATIGIGAISATLQIPIIQDSQMEGNEDFKVKITAVSNAVFADNATFIEAVVTIIDDEVPTLTVAETTRSVDESVTDRQFTLTFALSYMTGQDVTFRYDLTDITTTKEIDYMEPTTRTERIAANSTMTSISIDITDDQMKEGNETFKVVVSDIVGAVSDMGMLAFEQVITIVDDEIPTLEIDNASFAVAEKCCGG